MVAMGYTNNLCPVLFCQFYGRFYITGSTGMGHYQHNISFL